MRDMVMRIKRFLTGNKTAPFKPLPPLGEGIVANHKSGNKSGLSGTQIIQPYVSDGKNQTFRLDEILGSGFAVISWNNDPTTLLTPEMRINLKRLNFRFIKVVPASVPQSFNELVETVQDTEGHLSRWFSQYGVDTAIVRPDRYLYAVGKTGELSQRLEQLCRNVPAPDSERTLVHR